MTPKEGSWLHVFRRAYARQPGERWRGWERTRTTRPAWDPRADWLLGPWHAGEPLPCGHRDQVEPGSMLVAQMHYNTSSSAPVADQSTIEIATTDSVEEKATVMQAVDFGWVTNGLIGGDEVTIPAGRRRRPRYVRSWRARSSSPRTRHTLGLAEDAPLVLYTAGHHMHELGKSQYTEIQHADGSISCLLDTPDWDFAWQGRYTFANPINFGQGDTLWMGAPGTTLQKQSAHRRWRGEGARGRGVGRGHLG